MKTLLINPYIPLSKFYGKYAKFGAVLPPYGLASIASYMRKNNLEVDLFDANRVYASTSQIVDHVTITGPDIVGIYSTTIGFSEALELANILKKAFPDIILIIGGPHAIGEKKLVLENNQVFDYSCIGEGEILMVRLVNALINKSSLDNITGLVWRDGDNIVENRITEIVNLDDIPSPQRELPSLSGYKQKAFAYRKLPFAMMQTVRGCPFKCIFCSSPNYLKDIQGGKLRFHSLEWIENEIKYLTTERNVKEIYFVDDTFNCGHKRVVDICEMIINKFPNLIWSCNFEVKIATKELLQLMKRAGCWSIMIGAESGNQEILDFINKGITLQQIIQVGDWCHEIGLMGRASFILGHPKETKETMRQTIELARRIRLPFVTFSLMTPFPGTNLFNLAADFGEWNYNSENTTLSKVNFIPFGLSEEELDNAIREAYYSVYSDIRRNISLLRYMTRIENLDFILKAIQRVIF